jgi:hypothetical protein
MVEVEVLEDIELLFQGELKLTLKMEHLIPITIGAGGAAGTQVFWRISGTPSIFSTITSTGGGGGGSAQSSPSLGQPGGSGGGNGGELQEQQEGQEIVHQLVHHKEIMVEFQITCRSKLWNRWWRWSRSCRWKCRNINRLEDGGAGSANSITGSPVTYAGGGGGGTYSGGTAGSGGAGGGGAGAVSAAGTVGASRNS